ncbi:MAG: VCBS repeat-containing protein [Planctomycetota bacterium]
MPLATPLVLLAGAAAPQEIDYRVETDVDRETLGHAVAPIGDADGDGVIDFVATGDGFTPGGVPGAVRAYSGRSGASLWSRQFPSGGSFGMDAEPLGDLDGDGVADVYVGERFANGTAGSAWLFSGRTGAVIDELQGTQPGESFGGFAAEVGDVDGDGVGDFAVSAPGVREVRVFSGASRQLLRTLAVPQSSGNLFGQSMAGGGDFDRDGTPDLVVGNWDESRFASSAGSVRIFSLADGSVLFEQHGTNPLGMLGRGVAVLGDWDADGWPDFALSEYGRRRVDIVSGRSFTVQYSIERLDLPTFTHSVRSAGDVDGDGLDDLMVTAPLSAPGGGFQARGRVFVYGASGRDLIELEGVDNETLGWGVSAFGDMDGDGLAEILVGGPGYAPFGRDVGRVWVVSQDPSAGTSYCTATANSTGVSASAAAIGSPFVGGTGLLLRGGDLPPRTFGMWMASRQSGFFANPGGSPGNLCLAAPLGLFRQPGEVRRSSAAGTAELVVSLEQLPTPSGQVSGMRGETWYFQLWFRDTIQDSVTTQFTDGVSVTLR